MAVSVALVILGIKLHLLNGIICIIIAVVLFSNLMMAIIQEEGKDWANPIARGKKKIK